jgi:hypothetical protein
LRAPFRLNPDYTWDEPSPEPAPAEAPTIVLFPDYVEEGEWDGLVDVNGDPLFTEEPEPVPFGFCSQVAT